jgi:hypothetical protein
MLYLLKGKERKGKERKIDVYFFFCFQNFEPGYTMPPKKTPVVETVVTIR